MADDQGATSRASKPLPRGLRRMLAADRRGHSVVSRPCTGGIGDAATAVADPAIHAQSDAARLSGIASEDGGA